MNDVEQYYDTDDHSEWERLNRHKTEWAVTMRALSEFLPPAPARILDIGGGPGRYAIALAKLGYEVTLADISSESLKRAEEQAKSEGVTLAGIYHADATDLSAFSDTAYDAVLMLGPLYHLISQEARHQAVQEAARVLKNQGIVFAAFLNRFSALRVCVQEFPEWLAQNPDYATRLLETGIHRGEWGFTTAYFANVNEIQTLMGTHHFSALQIVGCEGIAAFAEERLNALADEAWEWWADLNYQLGKDAALHGSAIHLVYVGQKK